MKKSHLFIAALTSPIVAITISGKAFLQPAPPLPPPPPKSPQPSQKPSLPSQKVISPTPEREHVTL